jgi:tetratricopeptide (TPR) repeat protein
MPTRISQADWLIAAGLILLVAAVYAQTAQFDFVFYDDDAYVTENPHVRTGLSAPNAAWAFTNREAGNWHPLTWLSHQFDVQLFTLERPGAHHLVNVLIHAFSTLLLYTFVLLLGAQRPAAALAAALFAIHPLRAESVAWVAERKDVLSVCLGLATLCLYLVYARHTPQLRRYLLVLGTYALGLMAKASLVTIPVLLLLLDAWPLQRFAFSSTQKHRTLRWLIAEKLPFFALALAVSLLTYSAQQAKGAITAEFAGYTLAVRIQTAVVATAAYLVKFVWPAGLMFIYPQQSPDWPIATVVASLLLLLGITALAFWQRHARPYFLWGWLWYLVTLFPTSGVIKFGLHSMADRYTYLPQIGIVIPIAFGLAELYARRPAWRTILVMAAALWVALLTGLAVRQVATWHDTYTLTAHALSIDPRNHIALSVRGFAHFQDRDFSATVADLQRSLEIDPAMAESNILMARALLAQRQFQSAADFAQRAITAKPSLAEAHRTLGSILVEAGTPQAGLAHYQRAIELDPQLPDVHSDLGVLHLRLGQAQQAVAELTQAAALRPDSPIAQTNLGLAYLLLRRNYDALHHCQRATELAPNSPDAFDNLGMVHYQLGDLPQAIQSFRRATQLDPNAAKAWFHLGAALGHSPEAVLALRHAIQLRPDDPDPLNRLAWILATSPDDSIRNGSQSLQLAQALNQATASSRPMFLDTLAAAYAETGDFERAIATATQAIQVAQETGQPIDSAGVNRRLALYRSRSPYRDVASTATAGS